MTFFFCLFHLLSRVSKLYLGLMSCTPHCLHSLHHLPSLFYSLSDCKHLCEVFWNSLYEVWCRHEDGEGANDGEEREGHETEAVHHRRCKLPLAADGLGLILVPEPLSYVWHLLEDAHDLWWGYANPSHSCSQASGAASYWLVRVLAGGAVIASSKSHPRVTGRWAGRAVYRVVVAKVKTHGAIGGSCCAWGARGLREGHAEAGHGAHLYGAGAGVMLGAAATFITRPLPPVARLLHTEKPGTPVQQNHANLIKGKKDTLENWVFWVSQMIIIIIWPSLAHPFWHFASMRVMMVKLQHNHCHHHRHSHYHHGAGKVLRCWLQQNKTKSLNFVCLNSNGHM